MKHTILLGTLLSATAFAMPPTGVTNPWEIHAPTANAAALGSDLGAEGSALALEAGYHVFLNSVASSVSYARASDDLSFGATASSTPLDPTYGIALGASYRLSSLAVGAGARAENTLDGFSSAANAAIQAHVLGLDAAAIARELGGAAPTATVGLARSFGRLRPELDMSYGLSSRRISLRPALGWSPWDAFGASVAYLLPLQKWNTGTFEANASYRFSPLWEARLTFQSAFTSISAGVARRL